AVGLGSAPADAEALRKAAASAVRALAGTKHVVLALPAEIAEQVEAVTLGAELGSYVFTRHRGNADPGKPPVEKVTVSSPNGGDRAVKQAFSRAQQVAAGVRLTRDLVNTAPSALPPAELADAAVAAGKENGLKVQVLD